jgi:hypothetical protein
MLDFFQKRRRTVRAYRSIFMDGGRLKPEAETVLVDLAEFARLFKKVPPDPLALAVAEGGREVLRHILERLKIKDEELARQMRRAASEERRDYE